jgi:membrane protease YdiL (CAAX protease family)
MSMDLPPMAPIAPIAVQPTTPVASPAPEPPRTGAFSRVRARWLLAWTFLGVVALYAAAALLEQLTGITIAEDWLGILLDAPMVAWVLVMVVGRAGVDLRVLLRWPRLGTFWWVVVGLLVLQFLFSAASVLITQLLFPGITDALAGVGQGSLLLAIIGLVILPPLVEETIFRGVLIERFAVKWSLAVAIVVSAVGFGLLHVDPLGAGMFAVVTALLYLRTGSLWPGILIHAANNLVALASMRLTGSEPQPEVATADALMTAGVLFAVSVPFLAWFVVRHWPRRGTLTPYQRHELATGLPERHVDGVAWSASPGVPLRLTASSTHLVLAAPGTPPRPIALLPLDQVRASYQSVAPGGPHVVVLLHDGSWTTLRAQGGEQGSGELARIIGERVAGRAMLGRALIP